MSIGNMHRYCFAALLLLVSGSLASAGESIGKIKTLAGEVSIERAGKLVPAELGAPLFQSDRILTGKDGTVGILFQDDSRVSAGPDSRLELSSFNYNKQTQEGNLDVAMKKGTLSVISGKMVEKQPGSLRVRTPAAILAVRGTEFSIKVDELGDQEAPK